MGHQQSNSYKKLMEHYDVLTRRKWWSRMYMRFVWKEDDDLLAR